MKLSENSVTFIDEHLQDDISRLLLDAKRYPDMDIPFLAEQIVARRKVVDKLPGWSACKAIVYPSRLAAEQCSSELTARYKQRLIGEDVHLCDLTGGLGVDSYYFSLKAKSVTYIERFEQYAEAARDNFSLLGAANITVIAGNGVELAAGIPGVDVFYLDPARRGEGNKRMFALADCEPDLTALLPMLLQSAPKVIAKISPMADISHTLGMLPEATSVHVLSVRNECKELLFVLERDRAHNDVELFCVNLNPNGEEEMFVFTPEVERNTKAAYADAVGGYLYEPNASLLKAGAFKVLTEAFPVAKLHKSSHLYTSDQPVYGFPGRKFRVVEVLPFSSGMAKRLANDMPQANITVRNFPLTADALRAKTKIKDGGDVYLFATTLANEDKVLIKAKKLSPPKKEEATV